MTFSLFLPQITAAIASITSISGVSVKDKDEVFASMEGLVNTLFPNPNAESFISNFNIQFDSILQGANAPCTVSYTLNYRLLTVLIGDVGTWSAEYSEVIDKMIAVINALEAVPGPYSGRVEMKLGEVSVGPKEDPAGNQYHGADFALLIQEMQN